MPFSGQSYVAKAFGKLIQDHAQLLLVAVPGSYHSLLGALRRREIDAIIGILWNATPYNDLVKTRLYHEKFSIIARRDHPCHKMTLNIQNLAEFNWIVAPHGTPVRQYFETLFRNAGATPPTQTCEILSFATAEQTLVESWSVAMLTYSDADMKSLRPDLKRVDFRLPDASVDIGVTTLSDSVSNEPLGLFIQLFHGYCQIG